MLLVGRTKRSPASIASVPGLMLILALRPSLRTGFLGNPPAVRRRRRWEPGGGGDRDIKCTRYKNGTTAIA